METSGSSRDTLEKNRQGVFGGRRDGACVECGALLPFSWDNLIETTGWFRDNSSDFQKCWQKAGKRIVQRTTENVQIYRCRQPQTPPVWALTLRQPICFCPTADLRETIVDRFCLNSQRWEKNTSRPGEGARHEAVFFRSPKLFNFDRNLLWNQVLTRRSRKCCYFLVSKTVLLHSPLNVWKFSEFVWNAEEKFHQS